MGIFTTYIFDNRKNYIFESDIQLIFHLGFLKAYFGKEDVCGSCGEELSPYQGHDGFCYSCKMYPSITTSAHNYHAHKILDLILDNKNPLEYFDQFEGVQE